jgi:hypothetical protein
MIQFNLLPDVKKDYIKANRTKRVITLSTIIVSSAALAFVFLLFLFVQVGQKKSINDLTKDIEKSTASINETENINSMLTVQNQLALSPPIHEQKPQSSRMFDIVTFVSPLQVKFDNLDISFEDSIIILSGKADSAASVNLFVDNIKAAQYALTSSPETRSSVFSSVNTTISGNNEGTTFDITANFDPSIFNNTSGLLMAIGNQELIEVRQGQTVNE